MIIIYIFTIFFPNEAINVKDIFMGKIQIILPTSLMERLAQLHFSSTELLTLWSFLLIINFFVVIADVVKQILKEQTLIFINPSGETLFEINSIIFLAMLIYTRLYGFRLKSSFPQFSDIYIYILAISGFMFILLFCLTYCFSIIQICRKIKSSLLSKKRKS